MSNALINLYTGMIEFTGTVAMLKRREHTPPHLFLDNSPYFITGAIKFKRPLLKQIELKQLLLSTIQERFRNFNWELHHWVILDNHYHLMAKSCRGKDLPKIVKSVHGATAIPIARATRAETPIWWNYWDYCPRNENEFNVLVHYILLNPVKHDYVENIEDYLFSSFHGFLKEKGNSPVKEQLIKYPLDQFKKLDVAKADDF